jgi:hypothetical protein
MHASDIRDAISMPNELGWDRASVDLAVRGWAGLTSAI